MAEKITMEGLAGMIQRGFEETAKKADVDARFNKVEERLDRVEGRLDHLDARMGRVEADLAEIRGNLVYRHAMNLRTSWLASSM
jgi:hypothetical protein